MQIPLLGFLLLALTAAPSSSPVWPIEDEANVVLGAKPLVRRRSPSTSRGSG